MKFRQVLGSLTFRYTAKYVVALSAAVFALMVAIYGYFTWSWFGQLSDSILDELDTLQLVYRGQSVPGVAQYIEDQREIPAAHRFYYLVIDSRGEVVVGDLPRVPEYEEFSGGWLGFQMALLDWGESVDVDFLGRSTELGGGYRVLVARNSAEISERARLVFRTLVRAMIATLLLGLVGGFLSAARALRQVEELNRDLSRIIRASPGERLSVGQYKGYVSELAAVMNVMLDQMESLMSGVRQVSDNIAHDLRTPLTRLRNHLTQLRSPDQKVSPEDIDSIIGECDELLSSFNALLRISALESGSRLSGGERLDLQTLLQDVVELYEPVAADKSVSLSLETPGPRYCRGELQLLFQLFTNLLDNALKYTPSGQRVSLSLSSRLGTQPGDPGQHTVVIADSGPGIPVDERKNVFRRFYRVESSRGVQPGHGLGLSMAQAIAQYHHGSVELGSNNPGLVVRVRLPAVDA